MKNVSHRRVFGANKYAAFHLLFGRWLRHYAQQTNYRYITLGGTELRDIQNLHFLDRSLVYRPCSYENVPERAVLASRTAARLNERGCDVVAIEGSFFDFEREGDKPHIFFLDLEGTCAAADYHLRFAEMLRRGTLKEGDALFITSYLGRNVGWNKLFQTFDAEFRILGLTGAAEKQHWYRRAHPSFTLYKSLTNEDLQDEIKLTCHGCIEYFDTSRMALYGYVLSAGSTPFVEFIKSTPHYNMSEGVLER